MAIISVKRLNPTSKSNNDTGFGTNPNSYGGRFINKDGSYNVRKDGISVWDRFSVYHNMLEMPRWKFFLAIVVFFVCINIIFTVVYVMLGTGCFQGFIAQTEWDKIKELYFFSTETFTTVGYGRVNPISDSANIIASFEAMLGFLSFALATGLIYGRFSRPRAHLIFSDRALIAPFKDMTALMFRMVPYKDGHTMTDVDIKVTCSFKVEENGESTYKFFSLPLERSHVDSLMMNWTVVHPIDENSPLYGFTTEDMTNADLEVYVLVRGFDDVYSNTVLERTSYTFDEIIFNTKFEPMYHESEDGKTTILEIDKIHEYKVISN